MTNVTNERLVIHVIAYHRNGVGGEPFYVITFRDIEEERDMVAVLFENDAPSRPGRFVNPRTAVFDRSMLGNGEIAMGTNSWRGDVYDPALRDALRANGAEW